MYCRLKYLFYVIILQQQYSFVYDAVLDALLSGETTIPNSTFSEVYEEMCTLKPETSSTPLEDQFDVCCLQSLSFRPCNK